MRERKARVVVNPIDTLNQIKKWVGNSNAKSYTRKGCTVSMANLRSKPVNRVVLDVDKAYPTDKARSNQCDFILFHIDDVKNCLIGVPLELKRGDVDASEAVLQLQTGARIADHYTPNTVEIDLVPI